MTMAIESLLETGTISVREYCCTAGPDTSTYPEVHTGHVIAYVENGTFGYSVDGHVNEMVPGAFLIGRPGREFLCCHNHYEHGDTCLSFSFSGEVADAFPQRPEIWKRAIMPAMPQLALIAECARAARHDGEAAYLEEVAITLAVKANVLASGQEPVQTAFSRRDRSRALDVALMIADNPAEQVGLAQLAGMIGMSPFAMLRIFSRVVGTTPHQYRLRLRLRNAAQLLLGTDENITEVAYSAGFADLSNFVRTFRRASGLSPSQFRHAARRRTRSVSLAAV